MIIVISGPWKSSENNIDVHIEKYTPKKKLQTKIVLLGKTEKQLQEHVNAINQALKSLTMKISKQKN